MCPIDSRLATHDDSSVGRSTLLDLLAVTAGRVVVVIMSNSPNISSVPETVAQEPGSPLQDLLANDSKSKQKSVGKLMKKLSSSVGGVLTKPSREVRVRSTVYSTQQAVTTCLVQRVRPT